MKIIYMNYISFYLYIVHQILDEYFIISILKPNFHQYYHIYSTIGINFMNLIEGTDKITYLPPNYYNISKFTCKIIRKSEGHVTQIVND